MSNRSEMRNHRREQVVTQYLLAQPGRAAGATSYDCAVHILQEQGVYVSDKKAHDMWCSVFDLIQAGVIVEDPMTSHIRLATDEELKAKLAGKPDEPVKLELSLTLLSRNERQGND